MSDADWACEVVQEFRADRAAAARLAMLASLAVEIDASLLRLLRQTLMREAEPGIEADVWFSPLVEAHDAESCVLHEPILLELRRQLSEDAALFSEVAALTRRAHREWPAAVLLEEQLTELGYGAPPNLAECLDLALKPALRSLTSDDQARALEVARWTLRAWPRFHASLRAEPSVQSLVIGAALRLERPKLPLKPDETAVSAQELGWLVSQQTLDQANEVGLSLQPRGLRFVSPKASGVRLAVPGTRPPIVSLRWGGTEAKRRLVEALAGVRVELPEATTEVEITTLSGDLFVLSRVEEEPKPYWSNEWPTGAAPVLRGERLLLMQAIQASGARVRPASKIGLSLAIHVESDLWITPGHRGQTTLVEPRTGRQFRVLNSPLDDDSMMLLRPTEVTAPSDGGGIGAFIATDVDLERLGGARSITPIFVEVCIPTDRAHTQSTPTQPAILVALTPRLAMTGTLEVAIRTSFEQLPLVGALVVAGDRVVGMVVSMGASASTPSWLSGESGEWRALHAVTAQTMRRVWQRHRASDPGSSASAPNTEDAPASEAAGAPAENHPIDWHSLLPRPRPRVDVDGTPIEWDVFLSYCSADRRWALALYDVLTAAGFRVFVDQFSIYPGSELAEALQAALSQSASAVFIFSKASTDSEWVAREISTIERILVDRQRSASPFYWVIAKLDSTELPSSFRTQPYVDFSNGFESGPRGPELVRLVHGLVGQTLSEGALRAITTTDDLAQRMLAEISALNASGRPRDIVALIQSNPVTLETPVIAGAAAQVLISGGSYHEALEVLRVARSNFPRSIRLRQLEGLALRRTGRVAEGREVLATLYAEGHRDPETLGIYAATWMARYNETQDRADLARSRALYLEAYEISPNDEYVGINAASKSALLGELDLARDLAQRVVTRAQVSSGGDDFYGTLTFAEGLVILGSYKQAAHIYEVARSRHPNRTVDLASAAAQLEALLPALKVPEEAAHRLRNAITGTE